MIFLVIVLLILLFRGGASISVGSSPVIQNATGPSLSAALGNSSAPPNYYATGNPGYNAAPAQQTPTPVIAAQSLLPKVAPGVQTYSNPSTTQVSNLQNVAPVQNGAAPIVQPVAIRTRVSAPEVASAPWTRLSYRRVSSL